MAGLLDGFGDWIKTPEGQGLLAATFGGLAGARQGQPLNSLGRAGLAGISGYGGALDRQSKQAEEAQLNQYRSAQMANMQAEADTRKQALSLDALKRSSLPSLFSGGRSATSPLAGDASTGILPSAGSPAVAPSFDISRAVASGLYTPQEIEAWAKVPNAGMTEVARTMKGMQNGKEVDQQFDKYGRPVGAGLEQYKAPIELSNGASKMLLDPFTRQPLSTFKMEQSPDSKASNALGWANNALTAKRDAFATAEGGKPQLVDGRWVYKPTAQNPNGRVVEVVGMGDKPLNESQGAATNFGMRSLEANRILSQLEADGGGQPGKIKRSLVAATPGLGMGLDESMGTMMNFTQSAEQQKSEQARSDFLTAILRKESGASISPGEHLNGQRQYFVQPGDSDAVILQKQRNRELAVDGLRVQAGPGAKHIKQAPTNALGKNSGFQFLGFE